MSFELTLDQQKLLTRKMILLRLASRHLNKISVLDNRQMIIS